jgi:hypothetical protein
LSIKNHDIILEIRILVWERHRNVVGLNPLMESQPSALDNLNSNGNTDIKKNLHKFASTFKDYILSQN